MFRSRLFPKIRFTYSIAGNIRQQESCPVVHAFHLPLTFFQRFQYIIPPHRERIFSVGRADRAKCVPYAFFLTPYRTVPTVRPFGEYAAVVETDRDFVGDYPSLYSPFDNQKPYEIFLIGNSRRYRQISAAVRSVRLARLCVVLNCELAVLLFSV